MELLLLWIGAFVQVTQATLFVLPWNITASDADLKGFPEAAPSGWTRRTRAMATRSAVLTLPGEVTAGPPPPATGG